MATSTTALTRPEPAPGQPQAGRRGALRVYLGAAPGVGKTFAMLDEGRRRHERGTDVVVGFVETHGRAHTAEKVGDLEVIPRRRVSYRGSEFEEMDLAAVLARRPQVALVDELAHSNVPGSGHPKRWQDVEELLAAGIDVITTVNIQHLESLNDVVERIAGVPQRETIPDEVVRRADQIELVDMAPEALRRRMAHGNVYPAEKIDAALANYFRTGNLTALRELALLWVADRVEEGLQRYRTEHGIDTPWESRERIVVALPGGAEGDTLLRRAARIAARSIGADLLALHVARSDGLTGADPAALAAQRTLVESLGGSFHTVVGDDVATALLEFARAENATQVVLGASRHGRLAHLLTGEGTGARVTRLSGPIDVHMVTHEHAARPGLPPLQRGLSRRRQLAGLAGTVVLLPALTAVLLALGGVLNLASNLLAYLLATLLIALVGGLVPAVLAALVSSALLNFFFTPPTHRWTIAERNNLFAILAFVLAAVVVAVVVDLAARRTSEAARASAEAATVSTLAASVLADADPLPALLERIRETFTLQSVAMLERRPGSVPGSTGPPGSRWTVAAAAGASPPADPEQADAAFPTGNDLVLVVAGHRPAATDLRVLTAAAAQAATALRQRRLGREADRAALLEAADRTRTALLNAVSHDLRTPLASAKAAMDNLQATDVTWTAEETAELLDTARISLDRLARLVENLLDLSRLQAGAQPVLLRLIALEDVVPLALGDLGAQGRAVVVDVPDHLPEVEADPALLERVVANLLTNACRYAPAGQPPLVTASSAADRVELRVIDRGPGIPAADRDRVFTPFQRLGDRDTSTGVGLGLALARGLTEAMGGTLEAEDTPGGGLTMVVSLAISRVRT